MTTATPARILMLATTGFAELIETRALLQEAGFAVRLAAPALQPIQGVIYLPGEGLFPETATPDMALAEAGAADFDALVLPGGVGSPDRLRILPEVIALIRAFHAQSKPVAAICHAPWLLIEAGLLRDRAATGWRSIHTDLVNAGARLLDQAVVVEGRVITSRGPDDIPAFAAAIGAALNDQPPVSGTVSPG